MVLTLGEVTRMAVEMEAKGEKFYHWAAQQFQKQEVRNMFLRLSEEEKEHVKIFSKLLNEKEAEQKIDKNTSKYFSMLTKFGDIFPHHGDITHVKIKSAADALAIGIEAEKDAILFYQELYDKADSQEVKQVLSKLLQEEKMHLIELRESMYELKDMKH